MSNSEVAQLRERIELEVQAMRNALDGYAVVSRHDMINHKYEQLGDYMDQLQQHVGKDKAIELVTNALDRWGHGLDNKNNM